MRYLIVGYGGRKNKGCEALLLTTINQIREYDKNAIINVAVFDYDYEIKHKIPGVNKYIRHNHLDNLNNEEKKLLAEYQNPYNTEKIAELGQKEVLKETCDYCFSIGGDNYSEGDVPYLRIINKQLKRTNAKIILLGCSLYENIESKLLIEDLNRFDLIVPRETLTYNELINVVPKNKLLLLPDPAFSLKPQKINIGLENYICLNVSDIIINYKAENFDVIIEFINYLLDNYKYNILLLPHVYVDFWNDFETLKKIKSKFQNNKKVILLDKKQYYSAQELKYIISKSKYVIAARTHASIAAYSCKVPTLVLGYSIKSKGIAYDLFNNIKDYVVSKEALNLKLLIQKFDLLVKNSEKIRLMLNSKMKDYISKSSKIIKTSIEAANTVKQRVCKSCMGCAACYNICPQKTIEMELDSEGYTKAYINPKKCIHCNMCKKVCPELNNNRVEKKYTPKAYIYYNDNPDILKKSSSGGAFYSLSKPIIEFNGVVYGAKYHNKKVNIIGATNMQDLDTILGSKYVESNINDSYQNAKEDLEKNKKVIFSGTPCQIAGLTNFLNKDYENLIKISVICHGVPSQKTFVKYLDEWEDKYNDVVKQINFRNKDAGWIDFKMAIEGEKQITSVNYNEDSYYKSFLENYNLKSNCYSCKYHLYDEQKADIILGDYWGGWEITPENINVNGTSVIITNTQKGENYVKKHLGTLQEIKIEDIIKYNSCLVKSIDSNPYREIFYKKINKFGFAVIDYINQLKTNDELKENTSKLNIEIGNLVQEMNNQKSIKSILENQLLTQEKVIKELTEENNKINDDLEKIQNSKSWKITKPLRTIMTKIQRKER